MGKNNLNKILHHIAGLKTDKSTSPDCRIFCTILYCIDEGPYPKEIEEQRTEKIS